MKLNLGCAKDVRQGYKNVDLHYKHPDVINEDISNLSFVEDNTVEEIIAHDIIEHLPLQKSVECLKVWYNYLKPGGTISIQTTNYPLMMNAVHLGIWNMVTLNHMLFAGINYTDVGSQDCDFHKSAYSVQELSQILEQIGYTIFNTREDSIDAALISNPYSHNLNLYIIAKK